MVIVNLTRVEGLPFLGAIFHNSAFYGSYILKFYLLYAYLASLP